ncbi:MAG: hypothetical protein ACLVL7_05615 [Anaerotruncus massiliensis (ex Togo et al. 2019)]
MEDYASCVAKTAGHAHDSLKHKDSQRLASSSGGAVGGEAARDLFSAPLGSGDLDFVVPTFDGVSSTSCPPSFRAGRPSAKPKAPPTTRCTARTTRPPFPTGSTTASGWNGSRARAAS